MEARPIEQWQQILGDVPCPNGFNMEKAMARRVIGDLVGYNHPSGSVSTRRRRQQDAERDAAELANAMTAYARMMFDAGVRP
jgi:hypothetical protein